MKFVALLLITISGIMLASSLQQADSQLLSDGGYLLQGSGFVITEKSIENSELDFQFSTGKLVNGRMKVTLEDGLVSISGDGYLTSDRWAGTTMREDRFLRLAGDAQNSNGDEISLRLFGRLVENSEEGSVYGLTGRLTKAGESIKVVYTVKIVGSSNFLEETTKQEKPVQEKTIQISILPGASKRENINYYSLDTVEITPGTTIIWENDDLVPHRIMSGVASFSHGKPFKPDGKIDSGDIAPGQTFQVTINELGITRFFDTTYFWMDGVIISLPEVKSTSLKTAESSLEKVKKYK